MNGTTSHRLATYKPHEWQYPPLRDKSKIMLLTGSAGGGKSRLAGEKIHAFMLKYAGATGLVLRKSAEYVTKSAVPMLWHSVMGGDASGIRKLDSKSLFRYPNGSTLYWGGMDGIEQQEALRSIGQEGALDIIWLEEANAFTETDFNELLGRLRGRAASWRQIILSTNPDAPSHWINQRLIVGREATVYYSSAKDNPSNPADYQATLNMMTGLLYERLVLGRWVQAEGAVYANFGIERNVSELAEYNPDLPVVWGVDDGYAFGKGRGTASYHPRVILLCQETAQGGVNVFAEYFKCEELPEITIENVLQLPYRMPDTVYIDSSAAQLKARLWAQGLQTFGSTHEVTEGIKNLRRLVGDGNGVSLLQIHPRCTELIREFQSYSYDINSTYVKAGERRPLKIDDHGLDALRYACWHLRYGD